MFYVVSNDCLYYLDMVAVKVIIETGGVTTAVQRLVLKSSLPYVDIGKIVSTRQ